MKTIPFYLLATIYYLLFTNSVFAQTTLEGGILPFRPSEEPMSNTLEQQTTRGLFQGERHSIRVGFENIKTEAPFHLSISENLIDYGKIAATDPVSRTNAITILGHSTQGHTLQVLQNHSLKHNSSQVFIPDTTCDNGICNESIAQAWTGALTYGFGYRCDSITDTNYCLSGFYSAEFYKHFPSEIPQIALEGVTQSSAQMTFKVNISGTQAPQFYSNQVTFIAVPNF